jgi:LPXTG-site transpeptidase (sortase) family protein
MHSSNYLWIKSAYNTIGARLHELKAGDEYWVYYNGDRHRYIVKSTKEVSPSDVSVLDQPADERLSTLMTCTPVGTTLRRLVVVAQEVDPISGVPLKVGEHAIPAAPKIGVSSLPI